MTIEKAMKILRAVDGIECRFQGYTTALGIAMFALEKQLPKKADNNNGVRACPNCHRGTYNPNWITKKKIHKSYCIFCGQALDWSD